MGAITWLAVKVSSQSVSPTQAKAVSSTAADYVGSDACKDCHEDQFKAFRNTSHAELAKMGSWKSKVTGCESCHERTTWYVGSAAEENEVCSKFSVT